MSYRLQQSLSEQRCVTRNAPSKRSEPTHPFAFSTTIYRYGETDCDFVSRRRSVTMHLEGVRYYGYRYYNPDLGRWVNRDPIGGRVGINLYVFVHNGPLERIDALGDFGILPTPPPSSSKTKCCGDKKYDPNKECCCIDEEIKSRKKVSTGITVFVCIARKVGEDFGRAETFQSWD